MIDYPRLIRTLIRHECKDGIINTKPYRCQAGKLTIGVGRNLEDNGISVEEALILLRNDIGNCTKEIVFLIPDFWMLDAPRQEALVNMFFNLGYSTFSKFKKFIAAINAKDFSTAAKEMLDSKWAKQVKSRAVELSKMIEYGYIDEDL